jgi:nucleotide-binding universal stress UspA family protein
MKKIEKILFPIDFSEEFETLLPWVSTFVTSFEATLYVLFVAQDLRDFSSFYVPHGNLNQFQEEALKAAQKKMSQTAKETFKAFKKVESRVVQGSPADQIIETAKKENVDLIIMGTHGRKGLERAIFGSVCDKVVRTAPCPVLTINPSLS